VEKALDDRFVEEMPERLIGDRAYDSDELDTQLAKQGVELIAPHRAGRKKPKTQDGRKRRRYRRRWKIERFFARVFNHRRCVVRYEYKDQNFKAIVLLACTTIFLKSFFHL
jgi:transposase